MNWINDALVNINADLQHLEATKAYEEKARLAKLNDPSRNLFKGDLANSTIWSITHKEKEAILDMRQGLRHYNPQHETQRKVLDFLTLNTESGIDGINKMVKVYNIGDKSKEKINEYVKKSSFWQMKTTEIDHLTYNGEFKAVKWTFAVNEQMQTVICTYRGWFIVTTVSSHENIMRELEGKRPKIKNQCTEPDATDKLIDLL